MTECSEAVRKVLARRRSRSNRSGLPNREIAAELAELPDRCRPELEVAAQRVLDELPGSDEGALEPLLSVLLRLGDDDAVRDVALAALGNPFAMVKEDYVSFLEDVGAEEAGAAALLAVLVNGRGDPARRDLGVTIRALRALGSAQAVPRVADLLDHPDTAVRGLAVGFLFDLDEEGRTSADRFAERLRLERDPEVLEALVDGLRRWDHPVDPDLLRPLAEDPALPVSLRESARRALAGR